MTWFRVGAIRGLGINGTKDNAKDIEPSQGNEFIRVAAFKTFFKFQDHWLNKKVCSAIAAFVVRSRIL